MTPLRIAARLTVTATPGWIHRLRDCAEEMYRELQHTRYAHVENMDAATDTIWIWVKSKGKLKPTLRVVQKCVDDEGLWDRCEVVVDGPDGD